MQPVSLFLVINVTTENKMLDTFTRFPKMARLSRECIITEKLDGTNAQIVITEDGDYRVGSRTRWITPEDDNFGFAGWVKAHEEEILKLGPGRHFGEWWGCRIQRGYGLTERRFSLFDVSRWANSPDRPECCGVVPTLYRGMFDTQVANCALNNLAAGGSVAAPGFMYPEGIIVFHVAGNLGFKKTIKDDEKPKGLCIVK